MFIFNVSSGYDYQLQYLLQSTTVIPWRCVKDKRETCRFFKSDVRNESKWRKRLNIKMLIIDWALILEFHWCLKNYINRKVWSKIWTKMSSHLVKNNMIRLIRRVLQRTFYFWSYLKINLDTIGPIVYLHKNFTSVKLLWIAFKIVFF